MFRQSLCMILLITLQIEIARSDILTLVGDQCCQEDWQASVGILLDAFANNGNDLAAPAFRTEYEKWKGEHINFYGDEPAGVCHGKFSYKCNANKTCECNTGGAAPLNYVQDRVLEGIACKGDDGALCWSTDGALQCKFGYKCTDNPAATGLQHCVFDPTVSTTIDPLSPGGGGGGSSSIHKPAILVFTIGLIQTFAWCKDIQKA